MTFEWQIILCILETNYNTQNQHWFIKSTSTSSENSFLILSPFDSLAWDSTNSAIKQQNLTCAPNCQQFAFLPGPNCSVIIYVNSTSSNTVVSAIGHSSTCSNNWKIGISRVSFNANAVEQQWFFQEIKGTSSSNYSNVNLITVWSNINIFRCA